MQKSCSKGNHQARQGPFTPPECHSAAQHYHAGVHSMPITVAT